jgi:(R,R)-butanediol dehydrogenase/meso-butanediol dehydrogenase/diacetyl reductase
MRAAVYYGQRDVRIEEAPEPEAGAGQVKLRVGYNGLCGTDLHEFFTGPHLIPHEHPHPRTGAMAPVVIGHEFAGEIVAVGDGVEGLAVGDRIAAEPIHHCGECRFCRRGDYNLCTYIAFQGTDAPGGGLAEYAVVNASKAHVLPAGLGLDLGALVEPMSVAHHAVRRAAPRPDDLAVVYGGGPIGVGTALALRAEGTERIVVVEPAAQRRGVLLGLGFDEVLDPGADDVAQHLRSLSDGYGADVSFDTAGTQGSFSAAVDGAAKQGHIMLVATYHAPVSFHPNALVLAERSISSSCGYRGEDFDAVIERIAAGAYPTDGWVQRIPLEAIVQDGFHALHDQRAMKVLVDVQAGLDG